MKYYKLLAMCGTQESFTWHQMNDEKLSSDKQNKAPDSLLQKRRMYQDISDISNFFSDTNPQLTCVELKNGNSYTVFKSFEDFEKMVFNQDYIDTDITA